MSNAENQFVGLDDLPQPVLAGEVLEALERLETMLADKPTTLEYSVGVAPYKNYYGANRKVAMEMIAVAQEHPNEWVKFDEPTVQARYYRFFKQFSDQNDQFEYRFVGIPNSRGQLYKNQYSGHFYLRWNEVL